MGEKHGPGVAAQVQKLAWPDLGYSPVVKRDVKLECALLMSGLSWPQVLMEAGLFNLKKKNLHCGN